MPPKLVNYAQASGRRTDSNSKGNGRGRGRRGGGRGRGAPVDSGYSHTPGSAPGVHSGSSRTSTEDGRGSGDSLPLLPAPGPFLEPSAPPLGEVAGSASGEPPAPVPFILLVLLTSAGALAVLPLMGACSLFGHRLMLGAGILLTFPLLVLGALLLCMDRARLLQSFFAGHYSSRARARRLGCFWFPEKVQTLEVTEGESAGRVIETYAAWETNDVSDYVETVNGGNRDGGYIERDETLRPGRQARIVKLPDRPELNGKSCTIQQERVAKGTWSIEVQVGDIPMRGDVVDGRFPAEVRGENLQVVHGYMVRLDAFGNAAEVRVGSDGKLHGPGVPNAEFDGGTLMVLEGDQTGQAWQRAGYWRLDFVTKALIAMAVIGLEAVFAAVVLPPGVVSEASARLPLKAVFLVDGSGSITPPQWRTSMRANKQFIEDFEDVYSSAHGKLNFGFIQFSKDAHVEQNISHKLDTVTATLDDLLQRGGDTNFYKALSLCQKQLGAYTAAGPKTFDICVLITDGEDRSNRSESELRSVVANDTAVFGIFVGTNYYGGRKLKNIVRCGKAKSGHDDCNFFARATDFNSLVQRTREIAEVVARGSDIALCAERSALIEGPALLALILPCTLWYLSCCTITIAKRRLDRCREPAVAADDLE